MNERADKRSHEPNPVRLKTRAPALQVRQQQSETASEGLYCPLVHEKA